MLLHHPGRAKLPPAHAQHAASRIACWKALERLQAEGKARRIGVSNFEPKHIAALAATGAKVSPAVNQIEMHPLSFASQQAVISACAERHITIQAYSPLGSGHKELLQHPLLGSVARAVKRSPQEVLLRWSLQHAFVPIVKAANPTHQRTNLAVAADPSPFSLSAEQMRVLDELGTGKDEKRFAWQGAMDPRGYA
jgi:diketogulonate reductase-like aldo/keto reductase